MKVTKINTILLSILLIIAILWSLIGIFALYHSRASIFRPNRDLIWEKRFQALSIEKQTEILKIENENNIQLRNPNLEYPTAIKFNIWNPSDKSQEKIKSIWIKGVTANYQHQLKRIEIQSQYIEKMKRILDYTNFRIWWLVNELRIYSF
jgi:hypothetical protein